MKMLHPVRISLLALGLVGALPGQFSTAGDEESLFSVLRSQDDIHTLKTAQADLSGGRFMFAVQRLHDLLKRDRPGLTKVDPTGYLGMRTAVIRTLRDMPAEGQEAYEKLCAREAGRLLRTAFLGRDIEALDSLARRFPTSSAGRRARLRLGDLRLEAGEAEAAIQEYSALLEALPSRAGDRVEAERRLHIAQALLAGQLGGKEAADDEFVGLASIRNAVAWPSYGGGRANTRPMTFPGELGRTRHTLTLASPGYSAFKPLVLHATGDIGGLYFNTGHMVVAYDPVAGKPRWEGHGPLVGTFGIDEYFDCLNQNMLLAPAVSPDVVVAALQVPNDAEHRSFHQLDLTFKLPSRRLFGFDRKTGKRLWAHWDYQDGPLAKRYAAHNAPAPPMIVGDSVYAPTEHYTGAVSYYLSSYDLRTGAPRWRTLICSSQLEVNMFGNAKLEYAATPVAMHAGHLFGTTNLGLCYSADAHTGRVRWCRSYPVIPLPRTRLQGQRHRPVFFANNPVVVSDGLMICTPLDSEYILALDTDTGEIVWTVPYRHQAGHANNLRWVLGVLGDEVILAGDGVVAVKLEKSSSPKVRQVLRPQLTGGYGGARTARGAVADKYIVHPVPSGLLAFDGEGNPAPRRFGIDNPGNILMVDGLVVSARANEVQVYLDRQFLVEQSREAIRKDPANPHNYLKLATLMRSGQSPSELSGTAGTRVLQLLRQGLQAARNAGLGEDSAVYRNLAGEVFKIHMLQAQQAIATGSTTHAAALFTKARDEAHSADAWISAQLSLIDLHRASRDRTLTELDLLAGTHGAVLYKFDDIGKVPVRAYALWQSVAHLKDKQEIVARCQELLEQYPDAVFGRLSAHKFAVQSIQELIDAAGPSVYAEVEKRAAAALAAAGGDSTALHEVDRRFPHSAAADKARRLVLDAAVAAGDLATAAAMAARGDGTADPSMLRRLMVAADIAHNKPLAHALGERLLRDHGAARSDYAPDGGKTFTDVVRLPALPEAKKVKLQMPLRQIGAAISANGLALEVLHTEVVPGYPTTDQRPLYAAHERERDRLRAFLLGPQGHRELFSIPTELTPFWSRHGESLRLCGVHLIINEGTRVRAVHYREGKELWSYPADEGRTLRILGVQNGIVQLSSTLDDSGDGGAVLGLDVFTGSRLYTRVFPNLQETLVPQAYLGDLWTLAQEDGGQQVEVHRLDGVTGKLVHQFKIPDRILPKLLPIARSSTRLSLLRLLETLRVDATGVYLSTADTRAPMRSAVAGFELSGKPKWVWESDAERSMLNACSLHETGIVVLEVLPGTRSSSRVLLIDKASGVQTRSVRLNGGARILNRISEPFAPDLLLLEQSYSTSWLIGFSLTDKYPSFREDTHHQNRIFWRSPLVGEDFVATPVLGRNGIRVDLEILSLSDRRKIDSIQLPDRAGSYSVQPHDQYTVCQTPKGLLVYGEENPK